MNKAELRAAALDELRRRLLIPRAYAVDTGAPDALWMGRYPLLAAVDENIAGLRRVANAADESMLLPWSVPDGFVLLAPEKARALCRAVAEHEARAWHFLGTLYSSIQAGTVTTPEQITDAAWPI